MARSSAAREIADTNEETMTTMTHAADDSGGGDLVSEYTEDVGSQEAPVPLPVRDYDGEIRRVGKAVSKTSGVEYYAVAIFISPDQYPADYTEGEPDGAVLTYRRLQILDTPQGRFRMKQWYETLDLPAPGRRINAADWLGKKVRVTIAHEEYEGLPRAAISRVSHV